MIFPTASDLADFPGLVPWLVEGTWRAEFENPELIRDHGIRVTTIFLKEDGPDFEHVDADCELIVDAFVMEAAPLPYRTKLLLFPEYDSRTRTMIIDMATDCTCYKDF